LSAFASFQLYSAEAPAKNPLSLSKALEEDIDANADSLAFVGSNVIAKGKVRIGYKDFAVECDEAIVNISSKDIEAVGNVVFIKRLQETSNVTLEEFYELWKAPDKKVKIEGYVMTPLGEQKLRVTVSVNQMTYKGHKIVGNMSTGAIEFKDFKCKADNYYCSADSATRSPDGIIVAKSVRLTTCEYMEDDHEHYSVNAGTAKIFPPANTSADLFKYNPDLGDNSIWAYNCTMELGGVPVFWLPLMYKPPDESLHLFQVKGGKDSDWGYFLLVSKKFHLLDYPDTSSKFMLDFYSERGVAIGNETIIKTEESSTELFVYGLHDMHPYGASNKDEEDVLNDTRRLTVPKNRYDLRLSNVTHITPRLDFRGKIEKMSDINFTKDFFNDRYLTDPQPITFASLEYQFDRFSTSLLVRPRINNFNTEVERLPEFRVDIPRQELWKNIYYQGENSIDYFRMKWRHYDNDRITPNYEDPANYSTVRMDSLHMFYYPFSLDWLNLIPRAGFRMTFYSTNSKDEIDTDQLGTMFYVDSPDGNPTGDVVNYDQRTNAKLRFIGETGLEANTKIYRSWQNVKNAFWQLDGLRHVMVPYANYTFIPKPTLDRDKILYFDDIDRIDKQNFVRLGLKNRLQTRRGNYGSEKIYDWITLENYIDYHFVKESGFKNLGDFGTILKFTPTDKLTLSSLLLIDAGQSNDHDTEAYRWDRYAGRPGTSNKWINKWESNITYEIMKDLKLRASYIYQDLYNSRSAYSMGSTLTEITSTSGFFSGSTGRNQTFNIGMDFPIPIDEKTFGSFDFYYDFEAGYMREMKACIIRKLHCWEAALEVGQTIDRDYYGSKQYKKSVMLTMALTALPSVKIKQKQGMGGGDSD